MKPVVTGRVTAYLIEADGTRRLVFKDRANTIGADAVGRICYWAAHVKTSEPIANVGYTYGATEAYAGTSNAAKSTYSTTGYQFVATATWTNATGASKTVTQLRLLSAGTAGIYNEYAKLTGQSIVVGIGASLEVQWTYIMNQNASGGTGVSVLWLGRMLEYFRAATTTAPVAYCKFVADNAATTTVALGDPISGGATSSSNVVWQVTGTAPTGAATLAELHLYEDVAGSLAIDSQTGFSDVWVDGTDITDTITLTPVTM